MLIVIYILSYFNFIFHVRFFHVLIFHVIFSLSLSFFLQRNLTFFLGNFYIYIMMYIYIQYYDYYLIIEYFVFKAEFINLY